MAGLKPQRPEGSVKKKRTRPVCSVKKTRVPNEIPEDVPKKRTPVAPPPLYPLYIKGVKNPLIDSKKSKRPFTVALARLTDCDALLIRAVRYSGVLYKTGVTSINTKVEELSKNEHSGKGYALGTGRKMQESYYEKYPEKVEECMEFAKLLIEACKLTDEDMEKVLREGQSAYESIKVELEND